MKLNELEDFPELGNTIVIDGIEYVKKREPLSDKEITKNTPKLIHIGERLAFHAGVRFAEKHHGITGVDDDN